MNNGMSPEVIQEFMKAYAETERRKKLAQLGELQIEASIKVLSAAYDKAASYTNLIIGAGYAAFFATWGNVKQSLTNAEMAWSATFILVSLFVFILWECSSMIYNSRSLHALNKALETRPEEFEEAIRLAKRRVDERALRFRKFWVATLICTILPAIAGTSVLFRGLIRQLLGGL